MSYDVYKAAVMRVLPAAPEIPLEAPPAESFDLQNVLICPACGGADAAVQEVEDAEVAKCPQCQCEFSPCVESVSRQVIRRISEHRQRRMQRFMERLPVNPPVPRLDPTDYALFRKIADGISRSTKFRGNAEQIEQTIRQLRERFMDERTHGFVNPQTQQFVPPISQEEAEQIWARAEPRFRQALEQPDAQAARRYNWGMYVDEWDYEQQQQQQAAQ